LTGHSETRMDCNLEHLNASCVNVDGRNAVNEKVIELGTHPLDTASLSNLNAQWQGDVVPPFIRAKIP